MLKPVRILHYTQNLKSKSNENVRCRGLPGTSEAFYGVFESFLVDSKKKLFF